MLIVIFCNLVYSQIVSQAIFIDVVFTLLEQRVLEYSLLYSNIQKGPTYAYIPYFSIIAFHQLTFKNFLFCLCLFLLCNDVLLTFIDCYVGPVWRRRVEFGQEFIQRHKSRPSDNRHPDIHVNGY